MPFCKIILIFVRGLIVSRVKLSLEHVALRQTAGGVAADRSTPQGSESRPQVLDCGLTNLEGLAASLSHRPTRDSNQMASPGLQEVLALEVQIQTGRTSQAG